MLVLYLMVIVVVEFVVNVVCMVTVVVVILIVARLMVVVGMFVVPRDCHLFFFHLLILAMGILGLIFTLVTALATINVRKERLIVRSV